MVHLSYADGSTYEGQVSAEGVPHGRGVMRFSDGTVYDGEWENDEREGRGDERYMGDVYSGGWHRDKKHGKGIHRYANGDAFEGEFAEGKRAGHGKYVYADGATFVGAYEADSRCGWGVERYASGAVFEGHFRDDLKEGCGALRHHDGPTTVSRFAANQPTGEGARWSSNGKVAWRLVDGRPAGKISLDAAMAVAAELGSDVLAAVAMPIQRALRKQADVTAAKARELREQKRALEGEREALRAEAAAAVAAREAAERELRELRLNNARADGLERAREQLLEEAAGATSGLEGGCGDAGSGRHSNQLAARGTSASGTAPRDAIMAGRDDEGRPSITRGGAGDRAAGAGVKDGAPHELAAVGGSLQAALVDAEWRWRMAGETADDAPSSEEEAAPDAPWGMGEEEAEAEDAGAAASEWPPALSSSSQAHMLIAGFRSRSQPTLDLGASIDERMAGAVAGAASPTKVPVTRALLAELAKLEPGATIGRES